MAGPSPVKLAVQRTARRFEQAVNGGAGPEEYLSEEFAARDGELRPLLATTDRAELIGTVATRTLFQLHAADGRVVELLWREHDGRWLVDDCRVFSLIPGE